MARPERSADQPQSSCIHSTIDSSIAPNRARLLFSLTKANAVPNFTVNMGKALKKLVTLAGGAPEKDIFSK